MRFCILLQKLANMLLPTSHPTYLPLDRMIDVSGLSLEKIRITWKYQKLIQTKAVRYKFKLTLELPAFET